MSLDRLWAGWRAEYLASPAFGRTDHGCVLCRLVEAPDDAAALVLERTELTITVMNLYPYGSGHVMVSPRRHIPGFLECTPEEHRAVADAQLRALRAVTDAYAPEGVNVGANLGRAAGAGVPDHLHVHLVPRWSGDTNFMTSLVETRVLPESLAVGYERLRAVWPR